MGCVTEAGIIQLESRGLPSAVRRVYGDVRCRTDGDLLAVAYLDDQILGTMEDGGVLRRWHVPTGELLDLKFLSELESCWEFSPDGQWLASGGNQLAIWNVETGTLLGQAGGGSWVLALAFSPDGGLVATGYEDHTVRIWETATGKPVHAFRSHQAEVCALAFSPDGAQLVSAGEDRLLVIYDMTTGKVLHEVAGNTDRVDDLTWNPAGDRIASAGWDTAVRLWDAKTGRLLAILNGQGECVHSVAYLANGTRLVCGDSDCTLRVWDPVRLRVLWQAACHKGAIRRIAVHPDQKQLATGGSDRAVVFWDLEAAAALRDESKPRTPVRQVAVSGSGHLAAVHAEGEVVCWEVATGAELAVERPPGRTACVAVNPDGLWAAGFVDGRIATWPDLARPASRTWQAHDAPVRLLVFAPDGKELASSAGLGGSIHLWDPDSGTAKLVLPHATRNCTLEAIAYHPHRRWLAAAGINWIGTGTTADGLVALWDLESPRLIQTLQAGACRLNFSPDGRWLAAVSPHQSILIWDIETGNVTAELAGQDGAVNAALFDPSGRYLVGGSDDNALRVWDTAAWRLVAAFDLETRVKDLAFTPAGDALIAGNGNSTCFLVDLADLFAGA